MKHPFGDEPQYSPNVIVDSAFSVAKHELSNVRVRNSSESFTVTVIVRNTNDAVVLVVCAGLFEDEFCTYARYNPVNQNFECISAFIHAHNRTGHTVIRFSNAVMSDSAQ